MRYEYNKLVRDKIPSQINSKGDRNATWRVLNDNEYINELNKKLLEEANEFIEANDSEELADIMEVVESIMKIKNISWDEVKEKQQEKKRKKGGFSERIYLEYVDEKERNFKEEQELNKRWRKNN